MVQTPRVARSYRIYGIRSDPLRQYRIGYIVYDPGRQEQIREYTVQAQELIAG
jgi:hypothetical protein